MNIPMVVESINAALGTELPDSFFDTLGRETLRYERDFNLAAGFTEEDDELPTFFYEEALEPTHQVARFHAREVNQAVERWWANA